MKTRHSIGDLGGFWIERLFGSSGRVGRRLLGRKCDGDTWNKTGVRLRALARVGSKPWVGYTFVSALIERLTREPSKEVQ